MQHNLNLIYLPEAPKGCPRAIAPPETLTFSESNPNSRIHARDCTANASFNSNRSTSSNFQSVFLS